MDEPGTVFCLVPKDKHAEEIVDDEANREPQRVDPNDISKRFLRIGFDRPSKIPGRLATFGRIHFTSDVILGKGWSITDQCYFDFHPRTGELLLHDISKRGNTRLRANKDAPDEIWKIPRQCVLRFTCEWIFEIGRAKFQLIPRTAPTDEAIAAFTEEKLVFIRQPIPEDYEGTYEGTLERFSAIDLRSHASTITTNTHNLRVVHPDQPKPGEEIRYTLLELLGKGSQGNVHEVVDMYDGEHYARKVVVVKTIPEWGIYSESDFKKKVKKEVDLVMKLKHPHIVPYLFHHGWQMGRNIELFMPVLEESLKERIDRIGSQGQEEAPILAERMLNQILLALDHIHTRNPPVIHRDVKPANILCHGNNFFLTDFGIAKVVDMSGTIIGTDVYIAPEIWTKGRQTPKVDIFSLGVTVIECLRKFPSKEKIQAEWPGWKDWHEHLQTLANELEPWIASMLESVAAERPTARQLLDLFPPSLHASLVPLRNSPPLLNSGISRPVTNRANGTTIIYSAAPTPMDWTRAGFTGLFQRDPQPIPGNETTQALRPNPMAVQPPEASSNPLKQGDTTRKTSVESASKRQKGNKRSNPTPWRERRGTSQSAGVQKQTSSSRRRRSKSKSILKAQEIRDI